MNNKAQAGAYAIAFMLAVVVIILALAFAFPLNQLTTQARADTTYTNFTSAEGIEGQAEFTGMNCTGSVISDFTSAGCLTMDLGQMYFIGSLIAIGGIVVAARIMFG